MKTRIIKSILTLALVFMVVPTMGQDYMEVFFKDGNKYKFFMPYVKKIYVSKYDAEGNFHNDYQFQHVITKTNTYVYELADIDYISYTDCDEEEVEQNIVSSLETLLPILEESQTLSDVEERMESIKNADNIEDAWSDGSQLCIKIKDWGVMSFHFHAEEQADDAKEQQWEKEFMRKISSALIHKAAAGTSPLKVAIANQTKNNDMPVWYNVRKRLDKINNFFKGCGITPVYVDPSIDFFSSGMYDYDVVVLCTHGAVMTKEDGTPWFDQNGDNVHFLFTSEPLGAISKTYLSTSEPSDDELLAPTNTLKNLLDRKGLMDYLSKDEIRIDWIEELRGTFDYWVAYPLVTENFIIEASEGKEFTNSNSLIFAAVCHSLEGTHSLARKLQNKKNLNGYIGFDGEVSASVASNAALYYFMSLLSGNSMGKSEALIPDDYKFDTSWYKNTSLASSFRNEDSFLFSTVTKQVDQTTAQNAFNSSGYVEVEGNTTLSDPDADNAVQMGFEYSTNENFSPATSVVSSDVIKLSKPLDNGNGNVQFRASLTGLQPGNTYFYRAFTYDGLNYNYGETCSFELNEEKCPGHVTKVVITNGEYCKENDYPNNLYYKVFASLDDLSGVEEWGVYYNLLNKIEFPFSSVSREQTIEMKYRFKDEGSEAVSIDFSEMIADLKDQVGIYVKRRDNYSGDLRTLYSPLYDFQVRYDTKPSCVVHDPVITKTEIVEKSNGNTRYRTTTSFKLNIKGTLWIDNIKQYVNGNDWVSTADVSINLETDKDYDDVIQSTYWNYNTLDFSICKILYLRNSSQTFNSNYINWSGSNGKITKVWVSSTPAYSKQVSWIPDESSVYIEDLKQYSEKDELKKTKRKNNEIIYKKGLLSTCK